MLRSEMRCCGCINYDAGVCRLDPVPVVIVAPEDSWCSKGVWHSWSGRFMTCEPYFWGEWEEKSSAASGPLN